MRAVRWGPRPPVGKRGERNESQQDANCAGLSSEGYHFSVIRGKGGGKKKRATLKAHTSRWERERGGDSRKESSGERILNNRAMTSGSKPSEGAKVVHDMTEKLKGGPGGEKKEMDSSLPKAMDWEKNEKRSRRNTEAKIELKQRGK